MTRTHLRRPHALAALVVVRGGVLDVARVVGVSVVVPLRVQHSRVGLLDVRDVVQVPPVEPRGGLRPHERGRQLVVRGHGVRVTVPLPAHVLWLGELDVGRGQAQVAGPAVHRHVVGARTGARVLRVGAPHGKVGLVEVLEVLVVRPRLVDVLSLERSVFVFDVHDLAPGDILRPDDVKGHAVIPLKEWPVFVDPEGGRLLGLHRTQRHLACSLCGQGRTASASNATTWLGAGDPPISA
mmetsp:Transcript_45363/g.134278  ORF Transcript_45363/g.134278 Transcript_45363/m.134278 type:complete len:239 (+) Transcript_45363:988-1704(+)